VDDWREPENVDCLIGQKPGSILKRPSLAGRISRLGMMLDKKWRKMGGAIRPSCHIILILL
jgi:hypothetical protein